MIRTALLVLAAGAVCSTGRAQSDAVLRVKPTEHVRAMAFSPDGKRFAAPDGQDLVVWDTANAKEIVRFRANGDDRFARDGTTRIAFSPDGALLAAGNYDGNLKIWDAATGKLLYTVSPVQRGQAIFDLTFQADGKRLIWASGPDAWTHPVAGIFGYDLAAKESTHIASVEGSSYGISPLVLRPDGGLAAHASRTWKPEHGLDFIDLTTGRIERLVDDSNVLSTPAFSPDGKALAYCREKEIVVVEVATRKPRQKFAVSSFASGLSFSPDGKRRSAPRTPRPIKRAIRSLARSSAATDAGERTTTAEASSNSVDRRIDDPWDKLPACPSRRPEAG